MYLQAARQSDLRASTSAPAIASKHRRAAIQASVFPISMLLSVQALPMPDGSWEIVGLNDRELRFEKTVGDALRDLIRKRFKNNAAKLIERSWGLDPKTAKNVVTQGNVSERTLTKAARAERWELWHALGEEMFGESYEQFLQGVVDETEQAKRRAQTRRDQLRSLEARASRLVDLRDSPLA